TSLQAKPATGRKNEVGPQQVRRKSKKKREPMNNEQENIEDWSHGEEKRKLGEGIDKILATRKKGLIWKKSEVATSGYGLHLEGDLLCGQMGLSKKEMQDLRNNQNMGYEDGESGDMLCDHMTEPDETRGTYPGRRRQSITPLHHIKGIENDDGLVHFAREESQWSAQELWYELLLLPYRLQKASHLMKVQDFLNFQFLWLTFSSKLSEALIFLYFHVFISDFSLLHFSIPLP
ncbi:hypothetical protein ACJX0J_020286, partial [Zea mays]